jgi:hypothetical protein
LLGEELGPPDGLALPENKIGNLGREWLREMEI